MDGNQSRLSRGCSLFVSLSHRPVSTPLCQRVSRSFGPKTDSVDDTSQTALLAAPLRPPSASGYSFRLFLLPAGASAACFVTPRTRTRLRQRTEQPNKMETARDSFEEEALGNSKSRGRRAKIPDHPTVHFFMKLSCSDQLVFPFSVDELHVACMPMPSTSRSFPVKTEQNSERIDC